VGNAFACRPGNRHACLRRMTSQHSFPAAQPSTARLIKRCRAGYLIQHDYPAHNRQAIKPTFWPAAESVGGNGSVGVVMRMRDTRGYVPHHLKYDMPNTLDLPRVVRSAIIVFSSHAVHVAWLCHACPVYRLHWSARPLTQWGSEWNVQSARLTT
jgi:hypothetical protein